MQCRVQRSNTCHRYKYLILSCHEHQLDAHVYMKHFRYRCIALLMIGYSTSLCLCNQTYISHISRRMYPSPSHTAGSLSGSLTPRLLLQSWLRVKVIYFVKPPDSTEGFLIHVNRWWPQGTFEANNPMQLQGLCKSTAPRFRECVINKLRVPRTDSGRDLECYG